MKLKGQLSIAFLISLVSLICFAFLAIQINGDTLVSFDRKVISLIQGLETPFFTKMMKFFTFLGATVQIGAMTILVSLFLYFVLRHRSELLLLITSIAGTVILNRILKLFFQRARPDFHRLIEIGGYSFPSGHSMNAFSFYGIVTFLLWKHIPTKGGRVILLLIGATMILFIGSSRVYLGVHYPSDVIGAYFASGLWLSVLICFYQRYLERRFSRKRARA